VQAIPFWAITSLRVAKFSPVIRSCAKAKNVANKMNDEMVIFFM